MLFYTILLEYESRDTSEQDFALNNLLEEMGKHTFQHGDWKFGTRELGTGLNTFRLMEFWIGKPSSRMGLPSHNQEAISANQTKLKKKKANCVQAPLRMS